MEGVAFCDNVHGLQLHDQPAEGNIRRGQGLYISSTAMLAITRLRVKMHTTPEALWPLTRALYLRSMFATLFAVA